jgi:hypothetical protein
MSKTRKKYKTLWLADKSLAQLDFLVAAYGECASAVMRRLISEAYIVQIESHKKGGEMHINTKKI